MRVCDTYDWMSGADRITTEQSSISMLEKVYKEDIG